MRIVNLRAKTLLALVDQGLSDAPGFALIDPRQRLRIVDGVVFPAGGPGDIGHRLALRRPMRGDRHRGDGHLQGLQGTDQRAAGHGRVAVADHHHVLYRHVVELRKLLLRHNHRGSEVGHVAGNHAVHATQHPVA